MLSLGLMSGTSMDGIDAALLETDGTEKLIKPLGEFSFSYEPAFQKKLKYAENAIKENTLTPIELAEMTTESTELHKQAVLALLNKTGLAAKHVDVIGYHGQTLLHQPHQKRSIIIGDGAALARQTGIKVVSHFRERDIAEGGQGAPLAPLFHHALCLQAQKIPAVIINCGGIANITLIHHRNPLKLIGFDTGPGNVLIDRLVRQKTGGKEQMDKDGYYGKNGTVQEEFIEKLYQSSIIEPHQQKNYYLRKPPKSLDSSHFYLLPELIENLSLEDACATLEAFTADSIIKSFDCIPQFAIPTLWILAGGGWNNPVILAELRQRLKKKFKKTIELFSADEIGWHAKFMEAQLFAWLAVRSLYQLPLSVPGTTGVPTPTSGGRVHLPMVCE